MRFAWYVNTRRPPPFTVQLTKSLEKVNIPQTGTVFSLEVFRNMPVFRNGGGAGARAGGSVREPSPALSGGFDERSHRG